MLKQGWYEDIKNRVEQDQKLKAAQNELIGLILESLKSNHPDVDLAEVKLTFKLSEGKAIESKTILEAEVDYYAKRVVIDPPVRTSLFYAHEKCKALSGKWEKSNGNS